MTTNAHLQRRPPKPLRKAGLQDITPSRPLNAVPFAITTPGPEEHVRAQVAEVRRMFQGADLPVRNSTTKAAYKGAELRPFDARPRAGDGLAIPSRVGSRLNYPDGRVTDLVGNVIHPSKV